MFGPGFGLARYVQQLVTHLQKIDKENQYVLFVNSEYRIQNIEFRNFKLVTVDIPWYSWKEQLRFAKIIRKEKLDLMHFPHWNVSLFYNKPFVLTVHDLIMFHFPRPEATTLGPVKFWLKDMAHRLVIKRAVKKAKHIFVTSEFTKQDVHNTLRVPMEKMTVTYQAPFESSELLLKKYGIEKPYVLYVGAAYPHKNIEGLLKAWKMFENKYGNDYQLVLVGREDYFYKCLRQQCNNETMKQCGNVVFTGFVLDDELCSLYKSAQLFIYPSLYEGFGLPPLEALANDVIVASSNRTCLPEVLGEAVLYFDPENYEQMADVMYVGITDENIRFDLRQKIKQELSRYSWEKLARQTLAVYNRWG